MMRIIFVILFFNIKLVIASNENILNENYACDTHQIDPSLKLTCTPEKIFDREHLHLWVCDNQPSRGESPRIKEFIESSQPHESAIQDPLSAEHAATSERHKTLVQASAPDEWHDLYEEFLETIDSVINHEYMEFVDPIALKPHGDIDYGSVHGPIALFMADILLKAKRAAEIKKNATVVEFGCGGGRNVWKLAVTGCHVIANDLFEARVMESINFIKTIREDLVDHLTTDIGDACDFLLRNKKLEAQVSLIVAQNLLHFFTPKKLNRFAEMAFKSLEPKGEIHVLVESMMLEKQKALYLEAKANGSPYPGYQQSLSQGQSLLSVKVGDIEDEVRLYRFEKPRLISTFHFLDPETLTYVFTQAGFEILETKILDEQCMKELNPEDFPKKYSNIHVILRARKPAQGM